MQQRVAFPAQKIATVCGMGAREYWEKFCAPKIRGRKREMGRSPTNTDIAAKVEELSGKNTTRQLVEAWSKGEREPYISQLVALCQVMNLNLGEVLQAPPSVVRRPAIQGAYTHKPEAKSRKPYSSRGNK